MNTTIESISVNIRMKPSNEYDANLIIEDHKSIINSKTKEKLVFDRVYNESESNEQIYSEIIQPVLDVLLKGINMTIFTYGQTSTGKTFTMRGNETDPGIIPRIMQDLITEKGNNNQLQVTISYFEIYNETVNDLLDSKKQNLEIRENSNREIYVEDLSKIKVESFSDIETLLRKGDSNRKITRIVNIH